MTVEGIDVSTYQLTTPDLAGLGFVIARATYGLDGLDARYTMHAANVRKAGKILGAYHYWYPGDGAAQALHFLSVAAGADLLFLDLEGTGSGTSSGLADARDFLAAIHATGRKVGLYHSESGYPSLGQDYRWVAHWGVAAPGIAWDFHQYQGSPLDRDRWRGDLAGLQALVQGGSAGGSTMIYEAKLEPGTVRVASGVTVHGLTPGDTWTTAKSATGPATWHSDKILHRIGGTAPPTYAVHLIDGPLAGLYVGTSGTNVVYTSGATKVYVQADIDAAHAAGFSEAKTKAESAVQAI